MPRRISSKGNHASGINRRQWLGMLGVGSTMALAGCLGGDDDDGDDGGDDGEDTPDVGADEPEPLDLSQDPPAVSGEYHATLASSFTTLNPIYNTENNAGNAIGYAVDQGYTFDKDGELFPLLLEDLYTDDGGETWIIQIRDGLEFSDPYGQYTAEDFVYYVQEIHQGGFNSANAIDWDGVEVEETGELEVTATLESPNLLWPETFAPLEYPIPKDLLEPYVENDDEEGLQQNEELLELEFAGNMGAYVLDEWIRDGGTSYSRNDEYYLRELGDEYPMFSEAPYFETAEVQITEEESSRIAAIETGNTDNVGLPPDRAQEFIDDDDVMVVLEPAPYNTILSVNMRDNGWTAGPGNLFQVKEFRQALAASINKFDYIEGVLNGFAEPHYTWQPDWSEWFPGEDDLTLWGNPEDGVYGDEARDLAEQALDQIDEDYSYDGDVLITPDGDQVELELYYNAASETQEIAADFYASEFEEHLGFTLNTSGIDGTQFDENYWNADPQGGTDTVNGEEVDWGEGFPTNPGPRSATSNEEWDFGTIFGLNTYPLNPVTNDVFFDGANAQYNPVGYYPEFDVEAIFDEMRAADDRDELAEAVQELFINLNEEQPYIMLAFGDDIEAYNPDVRGPIPNFHSGWDFPAWHKDE